MANEFIARKGLIALEDSVISGSLDVSGSIESFGKLTFTSTTSNSIDSIVNLTLNADSDSNSGDAYRNIIFANRGSEKARIDANGNVGIGTTSPTFKLDVSGSVRIATDNPILQLADDNTATRYAATKFTTAGGNWILSSGDSNTGSGTNASDLWITRADDGSNNRFRFYRDSYAFGVYSGSAAGVLLNADGTSYLNGGNVGIGTTSPQKLLDVNGDVRFKRNIYGADGNYIGFFTDGGSALPIKVASLTISNNYSDTAPNYGLYVKEDAGIGTTSPSAKLHISSSGTPFKMERVGYDVYGFVQSTGTGLQVQNFTDNRTEMFFDGAGNIGIGTTSPTTKLHVTGITQIAESGNAAFYGGNYVRVFNDQNFNIRNVSGTTVANISVSGSSYFNGGNVGIGTTSPGSSYKLDVEGNTRTNGYHVLGATGDIRDRNTHNQRFEVSSTYSSIKTSNTHRLYVTSTGNVGIGTTSPTEKLHVSGGELRIDAATTNQPALEIRNSTGNITTQLYNAGGPSYGVLYLYNNGTTHTNSTGAKLASAGSSYFNGGNVGIGTTSPSAKLEIVHTDAGTDTLRLGRSDNSSYWRVNHAGNDFRLFNEDASGADILLGVDSGGNIENNKVGIGTTSPSQKLHVSGNIVAENYYPTVYVNHQGTILGGIRADATTKLEFKTLTTAPISFQVNSSEKMLITNGGNVGIGVNNPFDFNSAADNLVIGTGTGTNGISIYSGTDSAGGIYFADESGSGAGNRDGVINYNHSTATMDLKTGGNQKVLSIATGTSTFHMGNVVMENDLTVKGKVTAQEFHTEFVSASIMYDSGSTKFGDDTGDNHSFTGSILLSGSYLQNGAHSNSGKADFAVYTGEYAALSLLNNQVQIGSANMNYVARFDSDVSNVTIRTWEKDIRLMTQGSSTTQAIQFHTTDSGTTSEKMRITGAGNVGISTTSPTDLLHIRKDQNAPTQIRVENASNTSNSRASITVGTAGNAITMARYLSNYTTVSSWANRGGIFTDSGLTDGFFFRTSAGAISFQPGSNTDSVVFDTSGNVGIGTTTPTALLEVKGSGSASTDTHFRVVEAAGTGNLFRVNQRETIARFLTGSDGILLPTNQAVNYGSSTVYTKRDSTLNAFVYSQGGTEHFTIKDGGNVGIGTTSPSEKLTVAGNILQTSNSYYIATRKIIGRDANGLDLMDDSGANGISIKDGGNVQFTDYGSGNNTGTAAYTLAVDSSGNIIEEVVGAGTISGESTSGLVAYWDGTTSITGSAGFTFDGESLTAPSFVETSARRFKENIEPIQGALEIVNKLEGVTFNRIGEEKHEYGFIADEVKDVVPELVTYDAEGEVQGVHYARTVAILTEAIKELDNKVKAQDLFINDLVARIEKLEDK